MRPLDRKLLRETWEMRGQMLAITLVLAAGICMFLMYFNTHHALTETRDTYYQRNRFGDVFASMRSAPRHLTAKVTAIDGVAATDTRIVRDVTLDLNLEQGLATARLVSIDIPYRGGLNQPYLRAGRLPEPGKENEILINELFAQANQFQPGDQITAIVNGRRRDLNIVGIALSPEFIFAIKPGDVFPDSQRFGIFWMSTESLEAAFNMEGAFNNLSLQLTRDANPRAVKSSLENLLKPYGGRDAILRKNQTSHWFLESELTTLKNMGSFIPTLFFAVAMFLLNMVLSRLIRSQRTQIGVLKAFGYSSTEIGIHFAKYVMLVVCIGTVIGVLAGSWMGRNLTELYADYYSFPYLLFRIQPRLVTLVFIISAIAALLGAYQAIKVAVHLPPAEAMRPEPPAKYSATFVERMGLGRFVSPQANMILRHLERQPLRSGLTTMGIAMSAGLVVLGFYNTDAIYHLMDVQFFVQERQDANVTFYEPETYRAFHELGNIPGVLHLEPMRSVAARLKHQHWERRVGIIGLQANPDLRRVLDQNLQPISIPDGGLTMGRKLAEVLHLEVGDQVRIEVLEGHQPTLETTVVALVDEYIGANAYMPFDALNHLMGDDRVISGAYMEVDSAQMPAIFERLKNTPAVASVSDKLANLRNFQETMARNVRIITTFTIFFSCIIAFGVVYNSAQMTLSEREHDLATLRVLGFTRAEISTILLGELATLTLLAIPLGMALGTLFARGLAEGFQTELFRMPFVIFPRTYGYTALVILISAVISSLVVRRKLDRLDLMAVLKTRE